MARTMDIHLPDEAEVYHDELKTFVQGMVNKLAANAHKGKWEDIGTKRAIELLHGEIYELMVALAFERVEDAVVECHDIANFTLIVASVLQRDGK